MLRKTFPAEFRSRSLFVSPDARLAYLFQSLDRSERQLLTWTKELVGPGDVVWDVGANCGVFAVASAVVAGATGAVTAVEPDPFLAGLLVRSRSALESSDAPLEVIQAAVANFSGRSKLHVSARGRAASWLEGSSPSTQSGGERSLADVVVVRLDELLAGRRLPTIVKVDVEGSEDRVLAGAERLLREVRPKLLIEISEDTREDVSRRLRTSGYRLFDAGASPEERVELDSPPYDCIAIPTGSGG